MDIEKLTCFCLAFEAKSFSKAADESFFTRQAVSKSIKKMENEWDVTLFERGANEIEPTSIAKKIYPCAKRILSTYNEIQGIISEPPPSEGPLRIAVANGIVSALSREFAAFGKSPTSNGTALQPFIHFAQDCEDLVASGKFELAITVGPANPSRVRITPLKKESIYLVGAASLLDDEGHLPRGTTIFIMGHGFMLDDILLKETVVSERALVVNDEIENYDVITEMAKAGMGVCVTPESYLHMFENANVFREPISTGRYYWEINVLTPRRRTLSNKARAFFDYITSIDFDAH